MKWWMTIISMLLMIGTIAIIRRQGAEYAMKRLGKHADCDGALSSFGFVNERLIIYF